MISHKDLAHIRELQRRLENILRYATVDQVDTANAKVKVRYADNTTSAWLPFMTQRAGDTVTWHSPDIDERVLVLSPSGEPVGSVVLTGLYTNQTPAPSQDQDLHLINYPNGDKTQHHRGSGDTYQHISGVHHIEYLDGSFIQHDTNGNTVIKCTGNITIQADGDMVLKAAKIYEN